MAQTTEQTDAIIRVENVTNSFGAQVVHDGLDLTVQRGEVLALVGGSGSGKSVLLKTMTGLHVPNTGKVLLDGVPVAEISDQARAAAFGVLFQQGALFSGLTVLENVMVPLRAFTPLSDAGCREVAAMKLALAGLPALAADKMPSELSGGMIKRASLARAMAMDPRVLFLDEPTAGLDPIGAAEFDNLIAALNQSLGLTIVMVTHDLDSVYGICDRVAVLVDQKVTTGTVAEMEKLGHPWVADYFGGVRGRAAERAVSRARGKR